MSFVQSYTPNYFSIEDILVSQERIPSKFLVNVPKLGKLNPAAETDDIKPGTILELPLWLATELKSGLQPVISLELPRIYKEAYREILTADATAVDLHKFGMYFYELGQCVKGLDPRGEVSNILLHTFRSRFRQLLDLTDNADSDPTVQNQLDMRERSLYKNGRAARVRLNAWLNNTAAPLEAATMVVNHKKRKRIDLEELF